MFDEKFKSEDDKLNHLNFYFSSDVRKMLEINQRQLDYLIDKYKLDISIRSGKRIFFESDILLIQKCLLQINHKNSDSSYKEDSGFISTKRLFF